MLLRRPCTSYKTSRGITFRFIYCYPKIYIVIEKLGYPTTLLLDAGLGMLCLTALPFMKPRKSAAEDEAPKRAFEVIRQD